MENPNKVKYFDIRDFVSNIKIDSNVLEHMEDVNREFDIYMKNLKGYHADDIIHFWLIQTAVELASSYQIEKHYIDKEEFLKKDLFFETLKVNHDRIHEIHNFVMEEEEDYKKTFSYRTEPVRVSYYEKDGTEHIYWHAPEVNDVNKFMNDFIDIYKSSDLSVINSNPFIKSALIQLLFIRIHPYGDGNGRTSRLLYNIKFTEAVNKLYDRKLKLCPLNISASILINQMRYVNILDNIYFDMDHDNNEYINKWFDFILNMADEQIYYSTNRISLLNSVYDFFRLNDEKFDEILRKILEDIKELDDDGIKEYKKNLNI